MHCKICGAPGRSSGHPDHNGRNAAPAPKAEEREDEAEPPKKRTEVSAEEVLECKKDGLDILRTAQRLHCTLAAVKVHWSNQDPLIEE